MPPPESPRGAPLERLPALDGLRGVAALVVVLFHALGSVAPGRVVRAWLDASPLVPLVNASYAVQVFFVLSGFVLAGSLDRNRAAADVPQFWVRRVFRLHPPYMAGLLFAWLVSFQYAGGEGIFRVHLPVRDLLGYMLFPGVAGLQMPVGWTLRVELIFSFLMPLLFWLGRRVSVLLLVALCLVPLAVGPWGVPILKYALSFGLGVALYVHDDRSKQLFGRIGGLGTLAWVSGAVALGNLPQLMGWEALVEGGSRGTVFLTSVGSAGLVAAVAHSTRVSRFFVGRLAQFLGKISYSVYLLHWPTVLVAVGLPWRGAELLVVPVVLGLTIPLATLSYHFVERPSIRAGNRIVAWMARRVGQTPIPSRLGPGGG